MAGTDVQSRPIEILLVEDNPADVRLVREALKEGDIPHHLHVVADGEQAVNFVFRRGEHRQAPTPDVILLDLNLPRKSGQEVLAEIKSNPASKRIPVIVVTSSKARTDIEQVYELHANSYIRKPNDLDSMFDMVKAIETFWFHWAVLPAP